MFLGTCKSGYKYVLVLVDKFSKLTMMVPTKAPLTIPAAKAILQWSSFHGIPDWLISDGGSHFKNEVMKHLTATLGMKHHITTPHCPWANGTVERANREILWVFRTLCDENELNFDEWDYLLPFVQFIMNHRVLPGLGGRTPIEVNYGRAPKLPLQLSIWNGVFLKDANEMTVPVDLVNR